MLYPTVSNWWNERNQSYAIKNFEEHVTELDHEKCEELFASAQEYNAKLRTLSSPFRYYKQIEGYEDQLNIAGNGVIGSVTIDKIHVRLPIYHGTNADVLNVGIGHLEGSSLPVGGESTHSVLSGHRGLPSSKLFSDLDKMEIGDIFTVSVLDRTLTYQVDQILVVEPEEMEHLAVVEGKDYCTLLTCTPYGINTHRLLVRGTRIENPDNETVDVENSDADHSDADHSDANHAEEDDMLNRHFMILAAAVFIALLLVVFMIRRLLSNGKKKRTYKK